MNLVNQFPADIVMLKYISYIIYFLFLIHIFTFMPEDYSVTEFQHLCQMAEYEDYTVIDVDFIMTTLTQLRLSLSLSLYEVAAFKLLFPYWNPMEPSPPADKRGIRFLYRSVRLHFAFFGLAGLCPYSFVLFCRSKFFILKPNTTKLGQWPSLYTIIWLVSILPNYARVFQSLITDVSPKIWPKYGYDISYFAGLTRQKLLSVWIWSFAGLFHLFSSGSNMQLSSSSGWYE